MKFVCLDECVNEDSMARFIDELVDGMDTSSFLHSNPSHEGRPPHNPKDMIKLYLYGYMNGVFSSRALERACMFHMEAKWLMKEIVPHNKTISEFRRLNAKNLKALFVILVKVLDKEELLDHESFSTDGTKVFASNAKANCFNADRLLKQMDRTSKSLEKYMAELEKNDIQEDRLEKMQEKVRRLNAKKEKLQNVKNRIDKGETQVSLTDPDSRMMKTSNGGKNVCHNIQASTESKNGFIVAFEPTSDQNDKGQLFDMSMKIKENLGLDEKAEITNTADKGYHDTEQLHKCHQNNITTLVAIPDDDDRDTDKYPKKKFTFNEEENTFTCPTGQKLEFYRMQDEKYNIYQNSKACRNCPNREKCTESSYRVISQHKHYKAEQKNAAALAANPEKYKLRGQLSELPFAEIKFNMRYTRFLTRGNRMVSAETALIMMSYNIKKLRNIRENAKKGKNSRGFLVIFVFTPIKGALPKNQSEMAA